MPRKPIGETPMTAAERQARYRAALAQRTSPQGKPAAPIRRSADHRSQARCWRDTVAELVRIQDQYAAWLDATPPSLREGATAQALEAICDIDLSDLQAVEPPRGFGRD